MGRLIWVGVGLLEAKRFMYAELVYFDGAHFAHIINFLEHSRLRGVRMIAAKAAEQDRARALSAALAKLGKQIYDGAAVER